MSRRRTENRKRSRRDREAEKRRALDRIYDVPSARAEGSGPTMVYDLSALAPTKDEEETG